MEALLGFSVGFWDYITFLSLAVLVAVGLGLAVFVLGLPGRIAIAATIPKPRRMALSDQLLMSGLLNTHCYEFRITECVAIPSLHRLLGYRRIWVHLN